MEATLTLTETPQGAESNILKSSDFEQVCRLLADDKVKEITLPSKMLSPEGVEKLGQLLPGCFALESVAVGSGPGNQQAAATTLIEALQQVPNLREMSMGNAFVRQEGAEAIASLMRHHPTLEKLDIKYNGLMVPGTQLLAPALAHNGGLRELDISYNAMGAPGVDLLADALATNKGLVRINVDTTYDLSASLPNVEKALESNKNLLELTANHHLASETITRRLQENREAAGKLANALAADPEGLDKAQREALNERMAAAIYLLEHEKGVSRDGVMDSLTKVMKTGADHGVDAFPAMVTVLPFNEMLDLAERGGNPLTAKDFYHPQNGATPLLQAIIDRGVAAQIFTTEMEWESPQQLMGAYRQLPEDQREQIGNIYQLRAEVSVETERGIGRRMGM